MTTISQELERSIAPRTLDERDRAVPGGARRRDWLRRHLRVDDLRRHAPSARVRRPAGAGRRPRADSSRRCCATARRSSLRRSPSGFQRALPPAVSWRRSCTVSMRAIPGRSPRLRSCCPSWQWAPHSGLPGSRRASIRWRCCGTSKLRLPYCSCECHVTVRRVAHPVTSPCSRHTSKVAITACHATLRRRLARSSQTG